MSDLDLERGFSCLSNWDHLSAKPPWASVVVLIINTLGESNIMKMLSFGFRKYRVLKHIFIYKVFLCTCDNVHFLLS